MRQACFSAAMMAALALLTGTGTGQRELANDALLVAAAGETIWMTNAAGTEILVDSGRGVVATGVDPRGEQGVPSEDAWVVLSPARDEVRIAKADGTTSVIQTPFVATGLKARADEPTVWQEIVGGGSYAPPVLEIAEWRGGAWQRRFATVRLAKRSPSCHYTVRVRPSRYGVVYHFGLGDAFDDLLGDSGAILNTTGWLCLLHEWIGGLWIGAEVPSDDRILAWLDDGRVFEVFTPARWGWNAGQDFTLTEPTPGFPLVSDASSGEFTSFTASVPRFVPVPGAMTSAFHHGSQDDLVALVDDGAGRLTLMVYDEAAQAWRTLESGLRAGFRVDALAGGTLMSLTTASGLDRLVHLSPRGPIPVTVLAEGVRAVPGVGAAVVGGQLLFAASSAATGDELWVTDGTPGGTRALTDLAAGSAGAGIARIASAGSRAAVEVSGSSGPRVVVVESLDLLWRLNAANGHRYRRISTRSFPEAVAEAERLGGHLVTIQDAAEQAFLEAAFDVANLWIGLRRDPSDPARFGWVTGEPLAYTNWCNGEPSGPLRESAVHLADYPGFCTGGWNDQDPTDRLEAIVERADGPDRIEVLGTGCPVTRGLPAAELTIAEGAPTVGGRIELRMAGYFPGPHLNWFAMLGLPGLDRIGNGFPLPVPWRPDCRFEFAPVSLEPVASNNLGISATLTLNVPADPALFGDSLLVQGLQWAGGSYVYEFGATNALRLTIGL